MTDKRQPRQQRAIAPGLPMTFDARLTPRDRARFYNDAFSDYPATWADKDWLMGMWMIGNNYQGSGYHGAYPPGYLERVMAMFPDMANPQRVLQLFSGSLPPGSYVRVDLRADRAAGVTPDVRGDAHALQF